MIHSLYYSKDGTLRFDLQLAEITQWMQTPEGVLWINLAQPTAEEIQTVLRDIFHFHHLAIEDCLSSNYQPPKVDDFGEYIFIIVHALRPDCAINRIDRDLDTIELNCFLSPHYLVTVHRLPQMPSVQVTMERVKQNHRLCARGADFLCHAILDHLVDEFLPLHDTIDEELEQIETEIFSQPRPTILQRILTLKHNTLILRRIISPQGEVMNRLSRGDLLQVAEENRIYFRDIYDHLVRLHDLSESTRDVIIGSLDIYLSVASNRLNEIMKILTIISVIFLPLSFLAGLYGMNFSYIPMAGWPAGFVIICGICVLIGALMLWYFKRRGWF
jgi:magnesium transporter